MRGKGCVLGFKGGRNVAFWAANLREDPCVAPRLTRVQSQSDPADGLACPARAPDPNSGSDLSNRHSTRHLDCILTSVSNAVD